MANELKSDEILDKLREINQTLISATIEIEKVREAVLTLEPQQETTLNVAGHPLSAVPEYITGYTLDDLYKAFGKKRKSYASRLKSALKENQITTLEDFLSLSPGELLKLNNIGYRTLTRTQEALKKLGINW